MTYNKSPKLTLESIVALRGQVGDSAAWLKRYAATNPKDMDLPGLKLHELGGRRKGNWSVWVSGNWRVTFCFKDKDADVVDYEDYH